MSDYNVDEVLKQFFDHSDVNWKPSDKIPLIVKELELQKSNLKTFLVSSDYNIETLLKESEDISEDSNSLTEDLEKCKKEIEEETMAEIVKSIENYDTLSKELQSVTFATNIIGDVIQCGRYIKEYEEGMEAQSYTRSMEAVCDLVQYLELPTDGFDYLEIASKTREFAQLIKENLIQDLYTEWTRAIHWSIKTTPRKTIVTITIPLDNSSKCFDMLNALEICHKLPEKITEFAEFLMKEVLKPILYNECTVFAPNDQPAEITIMHKTNHKPTYSDVIHNYQSIFMYLSLKLSAEFKKGASLLTKLGKEISGEFSELLIKDCLINTVPNNIIDLQTYGQVTREIQSFQKFLVDIKFFPKDDSISILKYIEDIDVLFAERSSEHFLETARTIMLKDLSLSMSIGVESIPDEPNTSERSDALKVFNKTLPKSLFYFPRCMISKSAQELLDLVFMIMEQAVQCPDVVCRKLYTTTRFIFELYDAVVPYHHENYLQTIPQYVALFHNNCMYLAHNLLTLGDKWLTLMGSRRLDYPISFLDLVHKLRELGQKQLAVHLQQQRKQLLDNIRSSDLNCIVVKDVLGDNAEAAVRQCLRQLQLLKNVWIGVFPANVFTRLMATLVNMFVDELIHRVCTVEDISMEMATQLSEIYTLVVQKAPSLFQSQKEVEKHVKPWIKLQELIFVLGGSLKDIENHWDDGKGPLAVHFRTEELRSLIKALFQNTQIRANLLSKIK